MTDRGRLNKLGKCFRDYLNRDGCEPVEGYSNQFYDGVLWAFARLTEIYPPKVTATRESENKK